MKPTIYQTIKRGVVTALFVATLVICSCEQHELRYAALDKPYKDTIGNCEYVIVRGNAGWPVHAVHAGDCPNHGDKK